MNSKNTSGIALLISVLIGGIAISIATGVFNIFIREIRITRGLTPSLAAFYAADAGGECALFWEGFKNRAFRYTSVTSPIQCNGENINVSPTPGGGSGDYSFQFDFNVNGEERCARVRVRVNSNNTCTQIDTFGTNRGCSVMGQAEMVERGLIIRDPVGCSL